MEIYAHKKTVAELVKPYLKYLVYFWAISITVFLFMNTMALHWRLEKLEAENIQNSVTADFTQEEKDLLREVIKKVKTSNGQEIPAWRNNDLFFNDKILKLEEKLK